MNFYVDSGGAVIHTDPERIFQGSANANVIRFIGAFASSLPVTVAFRLPNGVWTVPQMMTAVKELTDVQTESGVQFNVWEYTIPQVVTENYGTVNVQFYVHGAVNTEATKDGGETTVGVGSQIASSISSFVVEKGVPITLPDPTDDYNTLLTQILGALKQMQDGDTEGGIAAQKYANQAAYSAETAAAQAGRAEALADQVSENWQKTIVLRNEAQGFANSAGASESAAETAANQAEEAAESAKESETNAKVSEKNAKESETNAKDAVDQFQDIIPSSATAENKLATEAFVNSSVNNSAAFYITFNAQGAAFPTHAALIAATTFYSGGKVRVPTQNDYATVLSDETQPTGVNGTYPTTRYSYQTDTQNGTYPNGQWDFQYVVNNTTLTQAQVDAINSGITAQKISLIDSSIDQKVNKDGDTMTGDLHIAKVVPDLYLENSEDGGYSQVQRYKGKTYIGNKAINSLSIDDSGNTDTPGTVSEQGERVYSPNNPPTDFMSPNPTGTWNTSFVFLPTVKQETLGTDPSNIQDYFKKLLIWISQNYPNRNNCLFVGAAQPSTQGKVFIYIYNSSVTNEEGYPKYASGLYQSLSGELITFGTNNFNWFYGGVFSRVHTPSTLTIKEGSTTKTYNGTAAQTISVPKFELSGTTLYITLPE